MLFNSFSFLVFFIVVTGLYFLLPHKLRWSLLLLASCFFYMFFKPEYILILLFTIIVDYYAGILIESTEEPARKKWYLIMSLVANIGVLAFFKYYNFFNENVTGIVRLFGWTNPIPFLKIVLPIGLSFHTFQAMSYTIEVYQGEQKAERHFGIYALYVMFYPQLVAGPIERPQNLLHQFHEEKHFDYHNLTAGLRLMLWGLFKKVVIADRLGQAVDTVYGHVHDYTGLNILLAAIFYGFQIYCDFSGYSDIAIGASRVMGFKLMRNFNHPLLSKSVTEFWRKWHISLSTWLSDYLYTPVVTARRSWGKYAILFSLMVTFFISGLWHGAAWNFVLWGVLHGVGMSYEFLTKKTTKKLAKRVPRLLYNGTCHVATLLFLIITWVFFRNSSIHDCWYIIRTGFNPFASGYFHLVHDDFHNNFTIMGFPKWKFVMVLSGVTGFAIIDYLLSRKSHLLLFETTRTVRWAGYIAMVMAILFLGVFASNQFIYFQF